MFENTNLKIRFSIYGDDFDLNDITNQLGIKPTEKYVKGEPVQKKHTRKETCWSYSIGYIETLNLEDLFVDFLNEFDKKKDIILRLVRDLNLQCKISVIVNIENYEVPIIILSKEIVEFTSYIGGKFDFDMYIY